MSYVKIHVTLLFTDSSYYITDELYIIWLFAYFFTVMYIIVVFTLIIYVNHATRVMNSIVFKQCKMLINSVCNVFVDYEGTYENCELKQRRNHTNVQNVIMQLWATTNEATHENSDRRKVILM